MPPCVVSRRLQDSRCVNPATPAVRTMLWRAATRGRKRHRISSRRRTPCAELSSRCSAGTDASECGTYALPTPAPPHRPHRVYYSFAPLVNKPAATRTRGTTKCVHTETLHAYANGALRRVRGALQTLRWRPCPLGCRSECRLIVLNRRLTPQAPQGPQRACCVAARRPRCRGSRPRAPATRRRGQRTPR